MSRKCDHILAVFGSFASVVSCPYSRNVSGNVLQPCTRSLAKIKTTTIILAIGGLFIFCSAIVEGMYGVQSEIDETAFHFYRRYHHFRYCQH